ncbi:Transposase and inactivated derivatives [Citrobacter werkmanii]|nr:Transposase and inactivated derivatives [Citrobacter werkmanii]
MLGACPPKKSTTCTSAARAPRREEALKRIGELYAIEAEIRGMPETERLAARQSRSAPLLASLHEWMVEKSATLSKKSRLGEAFTYALNQWDALCYYCRDGLAEPDNNAAERFAPSARERKTTSSSGAIMVANVVHCCTD